MFQKAIDLFNAFRQKSFDKDGGIDLTAAELGYKIDQLNWLINTSRKLHDKVIRAWHNEQVDMNAIFELEIITESFYHFAWRIVEITKNLDKFSTLNNTKVGRVRNNLIQHPEKEKEKAKFHPSFSAGGDSGPEIKGYNGPIDSLNDEGLFINAEDFNLELCKCLEKAILKI